jgi:hypothetical protein
MGGTSPRFETLDTAVAVERRDAGIRATSHDGASITLSVRGWTELSPAHEFDVRSDHRLGGRTREIGFPTRIVSVRARSPDVSFDATDGSWWLGDALLPDEDTTMQLPAGEYVVRAESSPLVLVGFEGDATFHAGVETATLSFSEPSRVTLGLRTRLSVPTHRLTIPPTPEGVATALTHLSAAHRTTTPDRTFSTLRAHPPLVEFGEQVAVPDAVRERTPETGIVVRTPDAYDALYRIASLSYHLGARVVVEDRETPLLCAPETGVERPLTNGDAAALLRRCFGFDAIAREGGPYQAHVRELSALHEAGLDFDAEALYAASPAERLARYLDDDLTPGVESCPGWQYTATVPTMAEGARLLPFLLDGMAAIRPEGDETGIEPTALSARATVGAADAPADADTPAAVESRFELPAVAFANRLAALADGSVALDGRPAIICNDPDRLAAARTIHEWAVETTAADDTDLLTDVTVAELDGLLGERPLVHFVGGWDGGFECPDGVRSPGALARTPACVVDAPGVAVDAPALVESGIETVFARKAGNADVGGDLVRGLVHGGRPWGALAVARSVGRGDYRVVGDPMGITTYSNMFLARLSETADSVRYVVHGLTAPGSITTVSSQEPEQLVGTPAGFDIPFADVAAELVDTTDVVSFDGELYWPGETDRLVYPFA